METEPFSFKKARNIPRCSCIRQLRTCLCLQLFKRNETELKSTCRTEVP